MGRFLWTYTSPSNVERCANYQSYWLYIFKKMAAYKIAISKYVIFSKQNCKITQIQPFNFLTNKICNIT